MGAIASESAGRTVLHMVGGSGRHRARRQEKDQMSERRHPPVFPGFREMSERRRALSDELVERRRALGLSQTQVAARMGTSQSAVARLETGTSDVLLSTVDRYASALGWRLEWSLEAPGEGSAMTSLPGWPRSGAGGTDASIDPAGVDAPSPLRPPGGHPRRPLDDARANRVGADLMTLDADGDGAVDLQIDCPGGGTGAALALMDIIDLLGVDGPGLVHRPGGRSRRRGAGRLPPPHHLAPRPGPPHRAEGRARGECPRPPQRLAEAHARHVGDVLPPPGRGHRPGPSSRSRRTPPGAGSSPPTEAVAYGMVDEVAAPDARIDRLPGRHPGFGPD